jgi:hypothetical protein
MEILPNTTLLTVNSKQAQTLKIRVSLQAWWLAKI